MRITPAALGALARGDMENFVAASTPGGIEAQEAKGQRDLVNSSTLPKDMLHGCTAEKLRSMGIDFLEDADDLFVEVALPEGWKKQPTDHSMWSDLLDDKGRKRAAIFYKAAFYDRSAHISLSKRYHARIEPEDLYKTDMPHEDRDTGNWYGMVMDQGEVIFKTEPIKGASYEDKDILSVRALRWLEKEFPDHMDELAYWD